MNFICSQKQKLKKLKSFVIEERKHSFLRLINYVKENCGLLNIRSSWSENRNVLQNTIDKQHFYLDRLITISTCPTVILSSGQTYSLHSVDCSISKKFAKSKIINKLTVSQRILLYRPFWNMCTTVILYSCLFVNYCKCVC